MLYIFKNLKAINSNQYGFKKIAKYTGELKKSEGHVYKAYKFRVFRVRLDRFFLLINVSRN